MAAKNCKSNNQVGETLTDASDGRAQIQSDLRRNVLNNLMNNLKDHYPSSHPKDISRLKQLAIRFEENVYVTAADEADYLRKISCKIGTMENITRNAQANNLQSGSSACMKNSPDPVQAMNSAQSFPNQTLMSQKLASQSVQSNGNIPGSADLSNMLASSQRQMQGRSQILPQQQFQQQPQSTNNMYQQQMQQQLLKQKLCYANSQQQQQQPQMSQQISAVKKEPFIQFAAPSGVSSGQQSTIQKHPQSVVRQHHHSQQQHHNIHPQRFGPRINASALLPQQQQKMLGTQSGNSSQQLKVPVRHHVQHPKPGVLTTQGVLSQQSQVPNQRMVMQQVQSQQLGQQQQQQQQQLGLAQNANSVQHDMQQQLQGAGHVPKMQTIAEKQKQIYHSQRALENSSTSQDSVSKGGSAGAGDWRDEIYQKINSLKEMYLSDLIAMHKRFAFQLQMIDSHRQQQNPDPPIEKMRFFVMILERLIKFLTMPRSSVSERHREKIDTYEKQILNFFYGRKPTSQSSMIHLSQMGRENTISSPQNVAFKQNHVSTSRLLHPVVSATQSNSSMGQQQHLREPREQRPIDRLIKAFQSSSPKHLAEFVSELGLVVSAIDRIGTSAPSDGSRAAICEDLATSTTCYLRSRNMACEGINMMNKMKRSLSPLPLDIASSAGNASHDYKSFESPESSCMKRQKIELDGVLLQEIKEINQRLLDTVVDICNEDDNPSRTTSTEGGGTIVTCSYAAVSLSPTFKAHYTSGKMSQIQPLRLLIPANYPDSSPILLDQLPIEASKDYKDLTVEAESRLSLAIRKLSEPMSLKDIATTWNACVRAVVAEYAKGCGGGDFSSKFGSWETCLSIT